MLGLAQSMTRNTHFPHWWLPTTWQECHYDANNFAYIYILCMSSWPNHLNKTIPQRTQLKPANNLWITYTLVLRLPFACEPMTWFYHLDLMLLSLFSLMPQAVALIYTHSPTFPDPTHPTSPIALCMFWSKPSMTLLWIWDWWHFLGRPGRNLHPWSSVHIRNSHNLPFSLTLITPQLMKSSLLKLI